MKKIISQTDNKIKKISILLICGLIWTICLLSAISLKHPVFESKNAILASKNTEINQEYEVEHFFTHCLIVNPKLAFSGNNFMAKDYDKDCLTSGEFKKIIQNFYNKGYVLVNANDCFEILANGTAVKKQIKNLNGKKPLILSIDDINYDHRKMNLGMADKIAIDSKGQLCSVIDGKLDYEREFVSIIDNFVKEHPDFSHNGAKAMLCLTGYDGILGYRTQTGDKNEIENAKKVVAKLKQEGYYFACHSYGHYHMKKASNSTFKSEITNWENEVEPLIGKTNIYVYPYGENMILENGEIAYKHKLLLTSGFKLFCGVGDKHFYSYYPFHASKEKQVLFMDRRPLDGYSLRMHQKEYKEFFDCNTVYDNKNRKIHI